MGNTVKKFGRYEGEVSASCSRVSVKLPVILFEDGGSLVLYCPALDLGGYGATEDEAKASFDIVIEEYFRYAVAKGTLAADLEKLGWSVNASSRKVVPPALDASLMKNRAFRKIFNSRSFTKRTAALAIPC